MFSSRCLITLNQMRIIKFYFNIKYKKILTYKFQNRNDGLIPIPAGTHGEYCKFVLYHIMKIGFTIN